MFLEKDKRGREEGEREGRWLDGHHAVRSDLSGQGRWAQGAVQVTSVSSQTREPLLQDDWV